MYKIKAPNEEYDRKIGGVQFVSGEAQTDNEWLAKLVLRPCGLYRGNRDRRGGNRADRGQTEGEAQK